MALPADWGKTFDPQIAAAASEASMGAIPSVLIAGVVGAIIFYLASPKDGVTTPSDIGRKWFAWAALLICLAILPNYIRDTSDDVVLVKWVIDMVFFGGGVFLLGWSYGKFFKTWDTAPSSASNSAPAPSTSAHNSGETKSAPRAEPAITAPSASQKTFQAAPVTPPPAMTKAAQQPTTNAHPQGSPASSTPPVVNVDHIYAQVAEEIESGNTDKGLWTRLWAECDGDDKKTKILYIKQRANVLIATEKARLLEEQLRLIKEKRQLQEERQRQDKEAHKQRIEKIVLAGAKYREKSISAIKDFPNYKEFPKFLRALNSGNVFDVEKHLEMMPALVCCNLGDGNMPLHNAIRNKNDELAILLIKYGALADTKNDFGLTPIDLSISDMMPRLTELLKAVRDYVPPKPMSEAEKLMAQGYEFTTLHYKCKKCGHVGGMYSRVLDDGSSRLLCPTCGWEFVK